MRLLIDTNIAILLRDRDETVAARLNTSSDVICLSLVSLVELEGGIAADPAKAVARRRGRDVLLARTTLMPLDRSIVDAYAGLVAHVGFSRRKILDRLIAATAIVHDLTLVTTNGDDFHDIPALRLEVWPTPAQ